MESSAKAFLDDMMSKVDPQHRIDELKQENVKLRELVVRTLQDRNHLRDLLSLTSVS